jgi:hypothetical protein
LQAGGEGGPDRWIRPTVTGCVALPALIAGGGGTDDRIVHFDRYEFGTLVADGHAIHSDVLVTPAGVHEHWWRREGHVLQLEDLSTLLDKPVDRLVVGTGAFGRMRPAAGLEEDLAARGVTLEVLPTAAAVDRINELSRLGAGCWAGALHLTC